MDNGRPGASSFGGRLRASSISGRIATTIPRHPLSHLANLPIPFLAQPAVFSILAARASGSHIANLLIPLLAQPAVFSILAARASRSHLAHLPIPLLAQPAVFSILAARASGSIRAIPIPIAIPTAFITPRRRKVVVWPRRVTLILPRWPFAPHRRPVASKLRLLIPILARAGFESRFARLLWRIPQGAAREPLHDGAGVFGLQPIERRQQLVALARAK
jgi:hypothetical protein